MSDPRDTIPLPRLVPIATACEYLAVSRRHVEGLIRDGDLDAFDVGRAGRRATRVSTASLRTYLARRALKPTRKPGRALAAAPSDGGS